MLEEVKGIIVDKNGIAHPFGINKMEETTYLTDENYHDPAFIEAILDSEWFQETGYQYNLNIPLRRQIMDMTAYGLTFILNGSSKATDGKDYYLYTIQCPIEISNETQKYLQDNYSYIKQLIEKDDALFSGEAYLEGDYIWDNSCDDIDTFYKKMEISINEKTVKIVS